jgi:hypothetical protein
MKRAFVFAVVCGMLVGCGSQPKRVALEGKVTYEGKPVARGTLFFNPDAARGNKGVFGVAEISNGEYHTNPDYGLTPGPVLVTVQVFDAQDHMLANIIDVPADISSEATSQDFHLTARDIKPIRQ